MRCPYYTPTERQALALKVEHGELFFGGGRGAGATTLMLLSFREQTFDHGARANALLVVKSEPELHDLKHVVEQFFNVCFDAARMAILPNRASIRIAAIPGYRDAVPYIGHEYTFLGFDSLTEWESPDHNGGCYKELLKTLRSTWGVPLRAVVGGSPWRPGSAWVKDRFGLSDGLADDDEPQYLLAANTTQPMDRHVIRATIKDNPHLERGGEYWQVLEGIKDSTIQGMATGRW